MEETGTVVELNTDKHKMMIRLDEASGEACSTCSAKNTCLIQSTGARILELKTNAVFHEGEKVSVCLSEGRSIFLSFLLFIFPLLILIVAYLIFASFKWGEVGAMFAAMGAGVLTFIAVLKAESFLMKNTDVRSMSEMDAEEKRTITQK